MPCHIRELLSPRFSPTRAGLEFHDADPEHYSGSSLIRVIHTPRYCDELIDEPPLFSANPAAEPHHSHGSPSETAINALEDL